MQKSVSLRIIPTSAISPTYSSNINNSTPKFSSIPLGSKPAPLIKDAQSFRKLKNTYLKNAKKISIDEDASSDASPFIPVASSIRPPLSTTQEGSRPASPMHNPMHNQGGVSNNGTFNSPESASSTAAEEKRKSFDPMKNVSY
jgi:hypothetical protein